MAWYPEGTLLPSATRFPPLTPAACLLGEGLGCGSGGDSGLARAACSDVDVYFRVCPLLESFCALPACLRFAMSHVFCRQSTGFSAVVSAAFHSESLIVELLCIPPPLFFFLDSSNLIILPSLTSPSHVFLFFPFPCLGFLPLITGDPL